MCIPLEYLWPLVIPIPWTCVIKGSSNKNTNTFLWVRGEKGNVNMNYVCMEPSVPPLRRSMKIKAWIVGLWINKISAFLSVWYKLCCLYNFSYYWSNKHLIHHLISPCICKQGNISVSLTIKSRFCFEVVSAYLTNLSRDIRCHTAVYCKKENPVSIVWSLRFP